eukprot:m51a1_g13203 hypothetical protein (106) ;mRNA; f:236-709
MHQSYLMPVIEYQLHLDQVARVLNLLEAVQFRLYWNRFGKGLVGHHLHDLLDLEQKNPEAIKKATIDIARAENTLISCGPLTKSEFSKFKIMKDGTVRTFLTLKD